MLKYQNQPLKKLFLKIFNLKPKSCGFIDFMCSRAPKTHFDMTEFWPNELKVHEKRVEKLKK